MRMLTISSEAPELQHLHHLLLRQPALKAVLRQVVFEDATEAVHVLRLEHARQLAEPGAIRVRCS